MNMMFSCQIAKDSPHDAKLRFVHRLKWMLSNGFWLFKNINQVPFWALILSHIHEHNYATWSLYKDKAVQGDEICGHTLSWRIWASDPLAIQETHPSSSPELQNVNFFTQSKKSKHFLPQEKRVNCNKFGAWTLQNWHKDYLWRSNTEKSITYGWF